MNNEHSFLGRPLKIEQLLTLAKQVKDANAFIVLLALLDGQSHSIKELKEKTGFNNLYIDWALTKLLPQRPSALRRKSDQRPRWVYFNDKKVKIDEHTITMVLGLDIDPEITL